MPTQQPHISIEEMPEGPLNRYIRDVYAFSDKSISFEDFKKEWEEEYDKSTKQRNIDHPVEVDVTIRINEYLTVHIFKRKGEDYKCHRCDMAPNGADIPITLEQALFFADDIPQEEKVEKFYNVRSN